METIGRGQVGGLDPFFSSNIFVSVHRPIRSCAPPFANLECHNVLMQLGWGLTCLKGVLHYLLENGQLIFMCLSRPISENGLMSLLWGLHFFCSSFAFLNGTTFVNVRFPRILRNPVVCNEHTSYYEN